VNKTTIYLPDDLKRRIEQVARRDGISEAEVIRRSLATTIAAERPKLRGALFESTEVTSERVEELLAGFGEHE
jgi:predicted transcriptional regulator